MLWQQGHDEVSDMYILTCTCTSEKDALIELEIFKQKLISRGYRPDVIRSAFDSFSRAQRLEHIRNIVQNQAFRKVPKQDAERSIPLVIPWTHSSSYVAKGIFVHQKLLHRAFPNESNPRLVNMFTILRSVFCVLHPRLWSYRTLQSVHTERCGGREGLLF